MTGSLRPRLLVIQGGRTLFTREILPGDDWRLGRHADSPLPLQERSISRVHVRVTCDAAGVRLEEFGSPNGTYLDGKPVTGTVVLRDGNLVRLGQSTNPDPILILFEDPGSRLLEAMGAGGPDSEAPVGTPVETPPPKAPPVDVTAAGAPTLMEPSRQAGVRTAVRPETNAERSPDAVGAPAEPEVAEADPREGRVSAAGRYAAIGVAVAAVLVLGLVFALRATQKPWQSVRVEPMKARAGSRVSLRGTEVEPSDTLKVFVGDAEATVPEMASGQVVFEVPRLPGGEAGLRPVALRVERQGIVLLRQTLQYETLPEIEAAEPEEAAVGDVVTLRGVGFSNDASRVRIKLAAQPAVVVGAQALEVRFRVPVVTRSVTLDAPLEVQIGERSAPPRTLRVRPREAPCFDLAFEARGLAEAVWEVRGALGPVLLVESPATTDGALPAAVQRALDVLRQAFAKAATEPAVRFEVREGRGSVLAVSGLGPGPTEVASFTPALAAYVRERAPEVGQADLLPYWSSVVLNELLNVFAKKQPPRLLASADPMRVALKRLQDLNVETGGQGCPSDLEMQGLHPAEREIFEAAGLRLPLRFGEVGGNWEGTLENAFVDKGADLQLRLELQQKGTSLKGRMIVYEVRGEGIRWSPPPVEGVEGRVLLGGETKVDLKMKAQPPYFITRLQAVLTEDVLEGTFVNDRRKAGRLSLSFRPGE